MAQNIVAEVLAHCVYAVGSGARMKIERAALIALRDHVEDPAGSAKGLRHELTRPKDPLNPRDPEPGEDRWKIHAGFVLECCEATGRLAAATAVARGSRVIRVEDLKKAYKIVSAENSGPVPGIFCPDFP